MNEYNVTFNSAEVKTKDNTSSMFKYRGLENAEKYFTQSNKNQSTCKFKAKDCLDCLNKCKAFYFNKYNQFPKSIDVKSIQKVSN